MPVRPEATWDLKTVDETKPLPEWVINAARKVIECQPDRDMLLDMLGLTLPCESTG